MDNGIKKRIAEINEQRFQPSFMLKDSLDGLKKQGEASLESRIRAITEMGLIHPIVAIRTKDFVKTGKYELLCGQGRWEKYVRLGESKLLDMFHE